MGAYEAPLLSKGQLNVAEVYLLWRVSIADTLLQDMRNLTA